MQYSQQNTKKNVDMEEEQLRPELNFYSSAHLISITEILGIAEYCFQKDYDIDTREIVQDGTEEWPYFRHSLVGVSCATIAKEIIYRVTVQDCDGNAASITINVDEWVWWSDLNIEERALNPYEGDLVTWAKGQGITVEDIPEKWVDENCGRVQCPSCHGSFFSKDTCSLCLGNGDVSQEESMHYEELIRASRGGPSSFLPLSEDVTKDHRTIHCSSTETDAEFYMVSTTAGDRWVCDCCGLGLDSDNFQATHAPTS